MYYKTDLNPTYKYNYGCLLGGAGKLTDYILSLSIKSFSKAPFDGQAALIAHTRSEWGWHHGTFEQVFPQINSVTKNYEDLSVSQIEQILADEEKRTEEAFEAIGIKFPANSITAWGVLIVAGVQLYFWLHLRERSPRMRTSDPGWDVAWIGVYPSRLARITMFTSTVVLPVAAAWFLDQRGAHPAPWTLLGWSVPHWLRQTGAVACTGMLGVLAWTRLPRNR